MRRGLWTLAAMFLLATTLTPQPVQAHILQTGFTVVWQDGDDRCLKESAWIAENDSNDRILFTVSGKTTRGLLDPAISCTSPLAPAWDPPNLRGKYVLQRYNNNRRVWEDCRTLSSWQYPALSNADQLDLSGSFAETVCGSGGYRVKALFQVSYNGKWVPGTRLSIHIHSPSHTFPT